MRRGRKLLYISGIDSKNVHLLFFASLSPGLSTHTYPLTVYFSPFPPRQAGVKNGMMFGKAKQLCPDLQVVPYDFEAYKDVAMTLYKTLARYVVVVFIYFSLTKYHCI